MITATNTTVFDIRWDSGSTAPGVNPYSARGLKGRLLPIDLARGNDKLARTVNGTLISIAAPQMRKYQLEVMGEDDAPAALDGLWVGMQVEVDAHVELAFLTSGGSAGREMVPGSERFEDAWTYYCPRMQMLVVETQAERQEWAAVVSWSLVLEEI